MIDMHLKYDNMNTSRIFNALICINNHVNSCINCILLCIENIGDLINVSPCIPLDGDVAEHVWSGKEASYKHLKEFGCRAFAHVPNVEMSKLDGRLRNVFFLATHMMILGTSFGTQRRRAYFEAEM